MGVNPRDENLTVGKSEGLDADQASLKWPQESEVQKSSGYKRKHNNSACTVQMEGMTKVNAVGIFDLNAEKVS